MPHNLVKLAVAARENIGTRHDVLPHVDDATTTCVDYATHATSGAPCFVVRAAFANPKTGYRATGAIREDRYTTVVPATAAASCLL